MWTTTSIIIATLPKATASISIIASIYGIRAITCTPQKQSARCNRLWMAMFSHDILRCLTFVTGTWLIPAGTDGVFMAAGNKVTCASQAFVSHLGYAVPLYSTCLSFYYHTEIKNDFKKCNVIWAEKWCHIIPNFFAFVLSIILIMSGQYGVDDTRCWIPTFSVLCIKDYSYFLDEGSNCVQGIGIGSKDISFGRFIAFVLVVKDLVPLISFVLSCLFLVNGLRLEVQKRSKNKQLTTGKRRVLEDARMKKARMVLTRMVLNLLAMIFSFRLVCIQRIWINESFPLILSSSIATTLFGLATATIFLKVRLPPNTPASLKIQFDPEDFSIRKSIISDTSFKMVTGGYVPKPKMVLEDDGGIYMGDDDDDDVESTTDFNGKRGIDRSDFMTSVSSSVEDNHKLIIE